MAANPVQYALNNIGKKAQQLFNPVGQAISRVPQQFGNYIQKTPQYQGAQMYQKAFQSPQVQNFVRQAPTQVIRLGQSINSAVNAPYNAVNRQMAPVLQQTRNMPLMQRVDTVLPKAAKAFSSNLLPGYVPNVVNPLMDLGYNAAKSAAKPFIPSDVKKYYGIRETGFEDVGNIAGGLGAANISGNIVGGVIGVGMNRLPVVGSNGKVSDAQAFDEGFKFSAKLGPLGKLAETPLKGLLNKINPETVNTVNSLVSQKLYKEAAKLLVRRAGSSAIAGGAGFGVYNTTLPAKNLQERVANALEGIATGAAFGAGTSIGGDVLGTGAKQLQRIYKNKPKLGMQSADAVMAPTDILISHEGAPDKARVEYYKKLIQSGKKVDPIVIINEGAKYGIEDGKHRFQAYKELGYNQVPVIFKGGEEYQQMMARAESSVKLPTQTGEITVYRGGRDMGDSRMLTPAKQNSGALFFTESEKYAKQYSRTPDQVSGLYKTNIKTDKIFDITNPQHIKQLEKHIQPEALQSMRDATNHGAVDWATASQYVDEIEKAGFKGAKFLERPAENITHLPDGSFKLEGKPVYSYALFDKQVPMTRASLPTQVEGKYLYHGTGETALENIAKEGLKPGRHTGNISLSPNEAYAQNWAKGGITPQGKTEGVMLRVNQDLLKTKILPSKSGVKADQLNELISKEVIPPEALEIFKDGKWQPLKSLQVEGLAKEASKYKSAEEFVKAQPTYYRGEGGKDVAQGKSLLAEGRHFAMDSEYPKRFGEVKEYVAKPDAKVFEFDSSKLTFTDLLKKLGLPHTGGFDYISPKELSKVLKEKGYDIIRYKGEYASTKAPFTHIVAITDDALIPKSQLTDIFNQSKGVQNADLSIKLPVAPQVVNGKIKMRPISAPTLETPAALSSNQELVGSGAGGGSSIKSTQEIINPQDPYFNVKRLNIDPKKQQAVKVAIEEAKPQFEAVVGKKLSNKEVVDFSNQSAKVLNKAVNREQTKQWSASMLKAREQLAISAQDDKLTPEFLDTLINVKSQGADIARKLQSLSINADPKSVTAKQAILEAVLKVTDDSAKILEAAKGVNFNDQAQATAFYRQFVKPKAEDWLTLVRYNSMLSSPNTHLVNTSSNFQGTGLVAPVEKTVLGGIDWMRSKATGTDRRYYAGEGVEYAKGYYSNLKNASENFTKVMRGESLSGNPDIRQLPLTTKKGLARTTEHVLNYPMRLLEGMDQFFSTLTQGGVERSLTYRQGKGIKVGNIESQAQQEAANRLFRGDVGGKDQGTLLRAIDQVTNLVFRARSNENPIVRTIATFTFPFVKTPMNVVKQMVEYSPAGILTLHGAKFKQEQLAKALMGAGVALGASQLLSSDRLTWAEPTNDKQRNAFRAAGLQPYAIKIGDKWISYAKLHPVIGFNLAMVASLNESFKNKKLSESEVETALTGLSKWWGYFADQSYIKNMGDLVASARGDLSGTARMLSNYPTQVIPFRALMSWVERIVDPYQRQADPNGSMLEKQLQLIGSQIPGIAGNVPTRNNLYGEPIKNQNRMINAVSPARVTTEVPDQKQIYDNMVEKSILTKQIKDIKDQAKQGKVVTGDATSTLNMGSDEVMKARFEASGDGAWNLGGKLYIKTDSGGVKVVDLQPNPTGNAIQQAKQSASNESQIKTTGVNAYFSTKLSDFDKNTIYKALGTNAQDVEFKALASLPDEKQASVLYSLLKERKWKQEKVDAFIKSDVLTSSVVGKMEDQGLINEAQAKDLKAYIKSTSIKLGKVSGSSKKAKKIKMPKLKTIKVKYSKLKIKMPKPKKYKSLLSKGRSNKYFK